MTASFAAIPEDIVAACCVDIVRAIADRPYLDAEGQTTRARQTVTLIGSLGARTPRHLMLAGQSVLLHTVAAEAARDIIHGMSDAHKLRAQGNIVAMNRHIVGHLDSMMTGAGTPSAWSAPLPDSGPARTPDHPAAYSAAARPDPAAKPVAPAPKLEPAAMTPERTIKHPGPVPPDPAAALDEAKPTTATPTPPDGEEPDEPDPARIRRLWVPDPAISWLDEPHETCLLETPAMENRGPPSSGPPDPAAISGVDPLPSGVPAANLAQAGP